MPRSSEGELRLTYLETWVRNVVVLILFGTLLELAIPSSSMRKYIRLVLGLVIMLALLRPVVVLFHADGNLQFLSAGGGDFAKSSVADGRTLWGENLSLVADSYRSQLEKTALEIAQQEGANPVKVTVGLGGSTTQDYGTIHYIRLNLAQGLSVAELSKLQNAESTYFDLQPSQIQTVY